MLELFNKGHTYSEIAAAFGVSKNTIAGVIDRNRGKGVAVNAPTGALSFLV
jgi:transposase